jgi:hypothetical protein
MKNEASKKSALYGWAVIGLLLVLILAKGFYAFFLVGDPGQPNWDFRPVKDIPGESPHAIYRLLPDPQHVRGTGGN